LSIQNKLCVQFFLNSRFSERIALLGKDRI
jgi:hypothetical protein